MSIETQLATCNDRYQAWKSKALFTNDIYEAKKAIERAFFWMELRSAFLFLHAVEQSTGKNETVKGKLLQAKINLSRKLTEYVRKMLETG